jgi:hypothetical protein
MPRIKNIIVLVSQYFTGRDYERYGIDALKNRGYVVSVWDLSKFVHPETIKTIQITDDNKQRTEIIRFSNIGKVIEAIYENHLDSYYISAIYLNVKTIKIYKAIRANDCKYGCTGPYTVVSRPSSNSSGLSEPLIKKLFQRNWLNYFISKADNYYVYLLFALHKVNYADYFALAGGQRSRAAGPPINIDTKIQHIHSANYDLYLKGEKYPHPSFLPKNGYTVFLDQYLPHHPDLMIPDMKIGIDPDKYYSSLIKYFDNYELDTGSRVLIAAHPKSQYSDNDIRFGGRKVVRGFHSAQIIKFSDVVIAHYSTAIELAILYRKPIIFVTTNDLKSTLIGQHIEGFSNYFNCDTINMSHSNIDCDIPEVKSNLYQKYIDNYIKKPGTTETFFWQQVASHISTA